MKITNIPLVKGAYYQEAHPKDTIFLHHTCGHSNPEWTIKSWGREKSDSTNKIRNGAAFVIGSKDPISKDKSMDGVICEAFNPDFWAHHLYIKTKTNTFLNQKSIAIKLNNYGELINTEYGEFYTKSGILIEEKDVIELPDKFRGERFFHTYSDKQLESLGKLLKHLAIAYDIDLSRGLKREIIKSKKIMPLNDSIKNNKRFLNANGFIDDNGKKLIENNIIDQKYTQALTSLDKSPFEIQSNALHGYPGLWSHSNVRTDQKDVYPHPSLISLIESL